MITPADEEAQGVDRGSCALPAARVIDTAQRGLEGSQQMNARNCTGAAEIHSTHFIF